MTAGLAGRSVLLVGGGKMGGAMAGGWLDAGLAPESLAVIEPAEAAHEALRRRGVTRIVRTPDEGADGPPPDSLVIAVKPQQIDTAIPPLAARLGEDTLVISIAAGRAIASLRAILGGGRAVVRAMPNTPAAIGQGATVACAGEGVSRAQLELAEQLLGAVGTVDWVEDETLLHAVTALSGGGPAYVFLLIEALAEAGAGMGLDPALASRLARQTVIGSAALARIDERPAAELRRDVTSPAGTTERALAVLMAADGLGPIVARALEAAAARSREMA